jgi:hypothetical protein
LDAIARKMMAVAVKAVSNGAPGLKRLRPRRFMIKAIRGVMAKVSPREMISLSEMSISLCGKITAVKVYPGRMRRGINASICSPKVIPQRVDK